MIKLVVITVWTATNTPNPTRFSNKENWVWASFPGNWERDYGLYLWEYEVELPEEEKGPFLVTEWARQTTLTHTWGKSERKPWLCFKAGNIVSSPRRIQEEETEFLLSNMRRKAFEKLQAQKRKKLFKRLKLLRDITVAASLAATVIGGSLYLYQQIQITAIERQQ